MNIFFWKNNKSIDDFTNEIALELYGSINPQVVAENGNDQLIQNPKKNKKLKKTVDRAIQNIIIRIIDFKVANSLGVYGKARLHLKFKLRLVELGYTEDFVNKINETIMLKTP